MPDPKLRAAQEEIKAILRKYDITGVVVLGSKTCTDFLIHLEASWNAIRVEDDSFLAGIRFKCNKESHPDKEVRDEVCRHSIGTLAGSIDALNFISEQLAGLLGRIGEKVEFTNISRKEEEGPDAGI